MALAEASIQSLLDFLRLNLWIRFDGFHKRGSLDKWKGRGGEGGGRLERIENEGEKIGNRVNNSLCEKCCAVKFDCHIGPFSYAKTKGYSQDNCHVSLFLFLFFFSSSPTCMNPCTSITVLFWQAKKAKLGILLGFYLTNALECFAICHFATENPRITPTTKERSNHYTSSTQNA